jgi:hypothetical protein
MILLAREVRFAPLEANYSVDENVLSNSPLQSHMVGTRGKDPDVKLILIEPFPYKPNR